MFTRTQTALDLAADPELVTIDGRLRWRFPSGRLLPVVRGGADDDGEKKFTQADVDRMIQERVARVKAEPPADYEALKTAKAELDQLKSANATELEKLTGRITALEADVATKTSERDAATQLAETEKRRSAVVAAASIARAANPNQVFALLPPDAVTIGNDGQVTGADEAVKKFLADNPHFVGKPTRPAPDPGQGAGGDSHVVGSAGRAEAARRFGKQQTAAAGAAQQ